MTLRSSLRRRAVSNGPSEERPNRNNFLHHSPPLSLPFVSGLHRANRSGSARVSSNNNNNSNNAFFSDDFAHEESTAKTNESTANEVLASIWRPSLCDHEEFSPPASPSRFLFGPSTASSSDRPSAMKIRQGSFKKCLTSPNFANNIVSSMLRWRGKREKKASNKLGSTSFLELSGSKDELLLHCTRQQQQQQQQQQLRHTASDYSLRTPPRRCEVSANTSIAKNSQSGRQTALSSASSSLLFTPESTKVPYFVSETCFTHLYPTSSNSSSSNNSTPLQLSSSSLLQDSLAHSPLQSTRSFEKLRGSLAWNHRTSTPSKSSKSPSNIKRFGNQNALPPLSPPPTDKLPPPPAPVSMTSKYRFDSLQPTLLQWERDLKNLSISLHEDSHCGKSSAYLQVNQSIKRSLEMDFSTPSTVTPTVLTPRAEAFEFELDETESLCHLSPQAESSHFSTTTSAPPTADSSFIHAVHSFPSPPLRFRSSSVNQDPIDQSSICYYSADSDIDPLSHFSILSSSPSSTRLMSCSSHQRPHIDSLTTSSHCSPSTYTSAIELYPLLSDDQQ